MAFKSMSSEKRILQEFTGLLIFGRKLNLQNLTLLYHGNLQ